MTLPTTWDLSVLYESFEDPRLEADWSSVEARADALLRRLPESGTDGSGLRCDLRDMQTLWNDAIRVLSFVSLTRAADARHAWALSLQNREAVCRSRLQQVDSAFCRRAGAVPDLEDRIAADPLLTEHAFFLRDAARRARHALPAGLEPAVRRMQLSGSAAFESLYEQLVGTHTVTLDRDGTTEQMPLSTARGMAHDPDPGVRKAAYDAELASYAAVELPVAACLNAIKGEAGTIAGLRGYGSVLEEALDSQHTDQAVLDALLAAIEAHLPVFRRYLRAKARLLGHQRGLPFYDLFAPLGQSGRRFTYDDAHRHLVTVLSRFSDRMGQLVDRAFREGWIDAMPRPGKAGGAFCASVEPLKISRVLTNFDGSFNSVSTLAHELGHAYHGACLSDQSVLNSGYPMPLAETASIFNEILVTRDALDRADEAERLALLDHELAEATQVLVDIWSRFRFESAVVAASADRSLSPSDLCGFMEEAQEAAYGDGLDPDHRHPYMWICKGHYYSVDMNFYNWPYAFGLLFGRGMHARYEEARRSGSKDVFLEEYDRLLIRSGQDSVAGVAGSVGMDLTDPAFWNRALTGLADAAAQFETLAQSRSADGPDA